MTTAPNRLRSVSRARSLASACLVLAGVIPAVGAEGEPAKMAAEIDYLVSAVAESDCTFIRNGREHDADAASRHLQMKRERGRRHYESTEEFIDRIASKSSFSGRDYLIRCEDGEPLTANAWFTAKLEDYREDPATD